VVHRDELDEALDAAVRGIMSAEPSAGFRQRVLRRIETGDHPTALGGHRFGLAAGFVVSVCVAIVVLLLWPRQAVRAPLSDLAPAVARQQEPATTPTRLVERPDASAKTVPTPRVAVAPAPGGPQDARDNRMVSATSLVEGEDAVVVPPLETVRTIETTPADPTRVHIDEIYIAPLRTEPLRIEPLSTTPR
jgi:hypothetical protein